MLASPFNCTSAVVLCSIWLICNFLLLSEATLEQPNPKHGRWEGSARFKVMMRSGWREGSRVHQEVALELFLQKARDTGRHRLETEGPGIEQRLDSREEDTYPPTLGFFQGLAACAS